jgi:hypothetical protein
VLAPLLSLRRLEWQSDDLSASGPILECFTRFTTLRSLVSSRLLAAASCSFLGVEPPKLT